MIKVENMTSSRGNTVPNQFIVRGASFQFPDDTYTGEAFQSYGSVIALKAIECGNTGNIYPPRVFLDRDTWDYSATTGRYRNEFLGEGIADTRKKIKSGEYILADLNR